MDELECYIRNGNVKQVAKYIIGYKDLGFYILIHNKLIYRNDLMELAISSGKLSICKYFLDIGFNPRYYNVSNPRLVRLFMNYCEPQYITYSGFECHKLRLFFGYVKNIGYNKSLEKTFYPEI